MDKKIEQELTYKEWEKQHNALVAFLKLKFHLLLNTPRKR
jgi:hypothetical protein